MTSMKKKLKIISDDTYLAPFESDILRRIKARDQKKNKLLGSCKTLSEWATGHLFYGAHCDNKNLIFREWAPNAESLFLVGDFSNWKEDCSFEFSALDNGVWELMIPKEQIHHLDYYKILVTWNGGSSMRLPSYAKYVTQDEKTNLLCSRLWKPEKSFKFENSRPVIEEPLLIYEAHIGMATEELKVGSFVEFTKNILPKIAVLGYNAIQLMAIQEHPYYGSFGYQVSNFFAPSSRFGTPDELKMLIDTAHGLGLKVIMDIVHSHAVKNDGEGLNNFDGSDYQYFHQGEKGNHPGWDTKCFDYSKPEVIHFLLSNCHYWISEFYFDGFRFDGVTSMLYHDHGMGDGFSSYADYFNSNVDEDALDYCYLANELLSEILPVPISIAEDMSGMPGLAYPQAGGGIGFSHRLSMGTPDFWIKLIKEYSDEQWDVDQIWYELTNVRWNEGAISYCESHDQALVGDKTIIFRLADKDMYEHFSCKTKNDIVDRALALHKMIRAITLITAKDGYLNFMGNEFGHPEWIDFPREGNNWSYQYTRRQWSLSEKKELCYGKLLAFEQDFLQLLKTHKCFSQQFANKVLSSIDDHVLIIERGPLVFCFNFHPTRSFSGFNFYLSGNCYQEIFNSDKTEYAGFCRLKDGQVHERNGKGEISLYLPNRCFTVLLKV